MDCGKKVSNIIRMLSTGVLVAVSVACPLAGEAALPRHPAVSVPAAANTGVARQPVSDPVQPSAAASVPAAANTGVARQPASDPVQPSAAASVQEETVPVSTNQPIGYTEAEIREQMIKKYTRPRAAFRRVSGADAGADYAPGSLDVKIPALFFPEDVVKEVSEDFTENRDGTFGIRAYGDSGTQLSGYSEAAQRQLQEVQQRKAQDELKQKKRANSRKGMARQQPQTRTAHPANQKFKTITVQVNEPAPSPFRPLSAGDFRWFTNNKGHYVAALLYSLPEDPLKGLPAEGPTVIRSAAQDEFMAVSLDDPSDTYYYKNAGTFPDYGKALPVYTETRKTIQGSDVNIKYIRYFIGGQYCLIVDGSSERQGKTCRAAVVFPESRQLEYLPKALYVMENLKVI